MLVGSLTTLLRCCYKSNRLKNTCFINPETALPYDNQSHFWKHTKVDVVTLDGIFKSLSATTQTNASQPCSDNINNIILDNQLTVSKKICRIYC